MPILTVGPNSTYPTIAAAMSAAHFGDQISLESGYKDETAVDSVNGLSITGDASSSGIHLNLGASVDNVTLLGSAPVDIDDNSRSNTIVGNDGANIVSVSSGVDVVQGGAGDDRLIVNYADVTATITGTSTNITDGGTHSVTFDGIDNFTINTGSGNDTITTNDGVNIVTTRDGNDTVTSGDGHNVIRAGLGNDTVTAGDGGNSIDGSDGNDTLTSGAGDDKIAGSSGDDSITGGAGIDRLDGGTENDTILGGAGNDLLIGGTGTNLLSGGSGVDTADYSASTMAVDVDLTTAVVQAVNSQESDTLKSIENIVGSAFKDTLTGNGGINQFTGGGSADHMNGGDGADMFNYAAVTDSNGKYDTITGFDASADTFNLWFAVGAVDSTVATGTLSTASFNTDLKATVDSSHLGENDAVLFTPDSGTLSGHTFLVIDANGWAGYQAGGDLVIELAGATHLASLNASDFV